MLSKKKKKKIGSKGFNLTKKWFHSTKFQSSMLIYYYYYYYYYLHIKISCSDNITAGTVKLNVTKSYILVNVVGVWALVEPTFLRGEVVNVILSTIYIDSEL